MPDIISTFTAVDRMSGTLGQIGGRLDALGDKAALSQRRMTIAGGAMAGAGAVVAAGLGVAVASAIRFDEELRNIQSISKQSDAEIGALGDTILDMAASGDSAGQSAQTMVKAMYDIYSSGFQGAGALDLLQNSAKAASAGLTNTETSTRVLAATLNAYGPAAYSAREASDILFQTVNLGVVRFEELASVMGTVMPAAAATGVSLEELGAAMSVLTRRGLDAAESSVSLNQMLMSYLKPSKEATELSRQLGIEFNLSALQGKGLVASLNEIYTATQGDATQLAVFFDNVRSARGAMSLMQDQGVMLNDMLEGMGVATEGAGATASALEQQVKSSAYQLKMMKAQVGALAIGLGQEFLPEINKVLGSGSRLLSMFMALPDPVKSVGAQFLVGASAALMLGGGMLVMIGYLPSIQAGLVGLGVSAEGASLAVKGLVVSVGLLAAVVTVGIPILLAYSSAMDTSDEKAAGLSAASAQLAGQLAVMDKSGMSAQEKVTWLGEGAERTLAQIAALRGETEGVSGGMREFALNAGNVAANLPAVGSLGEGLFGEVRTWGEDIATTQGKLEAYGNEIVRLAGDPVTALNMLAKANVDYESVVVPVLGKTLDAFEESIGKSVNWALIYEQAMGGMAVTFDSVTGQVTAKLGELKMVTEEDFAAAAEAVKTSVGVIKTVLPTVGEAFDEWKKRVTELAEANVNFEANMRTVYEGLADAGVSNIDLILRGIEEEGPLYAAQFEKWMAENPTEAVETLRKTVPPILENMGTDMTTTVMAISPEMAKAMTEGVQDPILEKLGSAQYVLLARQLGVDIMRGLSAGITSMTGMLVSQTGVTIDTALAAMEARAETGSPSERTRRLAQDLMAGLMLGLQDESAAWKGTAAQTASSWVYVFGEGWQQATSEITPAIQATFANLGEALEAGAAPATQGLLDLFVELADAAGSELGAAIEREQAAVDGLTAHLEMLDAAHQSTKMYVDALKTSVDAAEGSLERFASAPLVGTQKFSDQAFALDQQMNKLQLTMNQLELEALETGFDQDTEAARRFSQKIREMGEDLEVKFDSGMSAEERFGAVMQALGGDMDELRLRAQNVDLRESLELDPLRRDIDALLNQQEELTFDQIVAGIRAAQGELTILNPLLDAANTLYEQQEMDIGKLETALKEHTDVLGGLQSALDGLPAGLVGVATALNDEFGQALADVFATRGDQSAVAKAEALFTELSRVLDEGGKGELIPALQTQMDEALGVWTGGWQQFPGAVTTALAGVPAALAAGAPDAAAAGAAYADAVLGALNEKLADFNMWIGLSGSQMAESIAGLIGDMSHALAMGSYDEVYAAQMAFATFVDWLETHGEPGVADALRDIQVLFRAAAINMQSDTENGFVDLAVTAGSGAEDFMQAVIDVLEKSGRGDLVPAIEAAMGEGGAAAQAEAAAGGEATGVDLVDAVVGAVDDGSGQMGRQIGNSIDAGLDSWVNNRAQPWGKAIGGWIMMGIGRAFLDDWDAWAESIADIIYVGLQDALEAHSPSRRMIPLGMAMAAGLAQGFERGGGWPALSEGIAAPLVTTRMSPLLPVSPAVPERQSATSAGKGSKVVTLQANITVNVPPGTMDPAAVADAAYAAATRALEDMVVRMQAMEPTLGD